MYSPSSHSELPLSQWNCVRYDMLTFDAMCPLYATPRPLHPYRDMSANILRTLWIDGCGGEPGRNDYALMKQQHSQCLPGFFGKLGLIVAQSQHRVRVHLGRGQTSLKFPRSYLRLYSTSDCLLEWLSGNNQEDTWTYMGTSIASSCLHQRRHVPLGKIHCDNGFCHCENDCYPLAQ